MKKRKQSNIDLDDTVELPVISSQDFHTKKDPIWIIFPFVARIGILLALLLTITLGLRALYLFTHGTDISLLSANIEPAFLGYNGYGTVQSPFHPEQEAINKLKKVRQEMARKNKDTDALDTLISSIDCAFSKTQNLSNGMVIRYACTYDHTAAKNTKYNFQQTSKSYTVHDLQQLQELDPFEDFKTEWDTTQNIPQLILKPNTICSSLNIQYSYQYTSSTTAHITISYNTKDLSANGYFIPKNLHERDISFTRPDFTLLSLQKTEAVQNALNAYAASDLSKCSTYSFGKEFLSANDPQLIVLQQTHTGIEATFSIKNAYSDAYPNMYHFTVSYTGEIYQDNVGNVVFFSNTRHACRYEGFQQTYAIQKDVPIDTP